MTKILEAMQKQHEMKPHHERAERLEKKMDKVLEALANRDKMRENDTDNAAQAKKEADAAALQKAQADALKEQRNKQKEYWSKLKGFLENFKAKQYGKLSESKAMQSDSD